MGSGSLSCMPEEMEGEGDKERGSGEGEREGGRERGREGEREGEREGGEGRRKRRGDGERGGEGISSGRTKWHAVANVCNNKLQECNYVFPMYTHRNCVWDFTGRFHI